MPRAFERLISVLSRCRSGRRFSRVAFRLIARRASPCPSFAAALNEALPPALPFLVRAITPSEKDPCDICSTLRDPGVLAWSRILQTLMQLKIRGFRGRYHAPGQLPMQGVGPGGPGLMPLERCAMSAELVMALNTDGRATPRWLS